MDRIFYAGDSILTGSAIAKALLEYAGALAKADTSATVEIPTRLDDGEVGRSTFLVGPASQLVSDTEPSDSEEIVDAALIEYFHEQTRRLEFRSAGGRAGPAGVASEPVDDGSGWADEL
ncbi:hypothetical protein [Herbiconiux flava]|uniref:Uncharacterized protein n=1 Tax=Herbiconiux flava TaxID=881268 RepID=A0A852SNR7_9MICO|nr:hypothetical protein [Herbiconiux flava]NYD70462.1 hypothetical protein [Herbiconiux flava]GLK17217.1 hypothetical protein GCM10017602_16990 [Herbiconiux flava]